ncbi:calcium-binding protein [Rhodococcus sp. NPDC127530]|uniref:FMN-binding protein n=1 Tax=unclassified Rhodococcus (in: high G+C Gram-positive bacteria) TaxID=192944 RepID=UPI00362A35A1
MRTDTLTRAALATVVSAVALVPLAGCSGLGTGPSPSESVPATESTRPPESSTGSATYEDGTYNAIGEYGGGPSYLNVTVTISDEVIADVTVGTMAENETSLGYQERFAAAVPDEVIGKSLDEAEVGRLAGASTCPDGFNDAIEQIREQARSTDGN